MRSTPRKPQIYWEALQDEKKREDFRRATDAAARTLNRQGEPRYSKIAKVRTETATNICGKKKKQLLVPWMAGREESLAELRNAVATAVQEVREKKGTFAQEQTDQNKNLLDQAITGRKIARREHRVTLRSWERQYWEEVIEEMRLAQEKGDYGEMYRILRKLGQRGKAKAPPSSHFTPEEFKEHFAKVSQYEFEKDVESWQEVLTKIEDRRERDEYREAGVKLNETPRREEIWQAIRSMKDKAPGEDDVRISYIRKAGKTAQEYVIRTVQKIFETDPSEWEAILESGLVIPIFKKGSRSDRNNYRGVCLLAMGSRILARVPATRVRNWAEETKLVEDNQQGFRKGRSTMDATQIIYRIQEEVSEDIKDKNAIHLDTSDGALDPGAVLLDITKAYPRVNRPAMWAILQRAGMGERCLRTIKSIHEKTTYKVRGKEDCSTQWRANRGLREGCATYPTLFNIYHAEVLRQAKVRRKEECEQQQAKMGIEWMFVRGSSFPPRSTNKAMKSSDAEMVMISETLFADDTTLVGTREELRKNVGAVKEVMGRFEEKCHDGKEEWAFFGRQNSENIRMLGTWLGRERNLKERLRRGNMAWFTLKRRLSKASIPRKTQAKVVEAGVESTMMFDCAARPWMKSEMKKMQQLVDRCYRFVWMDRRGGPGLRQMEQKEVNMFDIRRQWGVDSIETKIARRSLERIGHMVRMKDERMTKQVTLGWLKKETVIPGRKSKKPTTIAFWRKLLREAGVDVDTMERAASDRDRWKAICKKEHRRRAAKEMSRCKRRTDGDTEVTTDTETNAEERNICDWEGYGEEFDTKIGLVQHQRLKHKRTTRKFMCPLCDSGFKQQSNLTNHMKVCRGPAGGCRWFGKPISASNIARHERTCRRRVTETNEEREKKEDEEGETQQKVEPRERRPKKPKFPCCACGKGVTGGVKCTVSGKWCHFACAKVTYKSAKNWSSDVRYSWRCPNH